MSDLTIPTSLTSQPLAERPPNRPPIRFLGTPMAAATEDETAEEIREQHPLSGTFSSKEEEALLYDPDVAREALSFHLSDPEKTKEEYHLQFASKLAELKKNLNEEELKIKSPTEKEPVELMNALCRLEGHAKRGPSHDKKEQEEHFSGVRETTDELLNMECPEPIQEAIVELVGLSFAMEVMDAATHYKNSFLHREIGINDQITDPAEQVLRVPTIIGERVSTVQKDLEQFETAAQRVIELVRQRNGYSQKIKRNIPEEEKELWGKCREYTRLAIDGYLSFARAVKEDNLDQARIEKAQALEAFCNLKETEAEAAEDRQKFKSAALAAHYALEYFRNAALEAINKKKKDAWILAGSYRLQQVEAVAAEDQLGITNLARASEAALDAAINFNKAAAQFNLNKEGTFQEVSTEEKNAWNLAGSYKLREAEAHATENQSSVTNFARAAKAAEFAVSHFIRAASKGTSVEEKNALIIAGSFSLQGAEAAAHDEESYVNFKKAAEVALEAASNFSDAAKEKRNAGKKEALEKVGFYNFQKAASIAAGNYPEAKKVEMTAKAVQSAARIFGVIAGEGISSKREAELNDMALYYLKHASLWEDDPNKAKDFNYDRYKKEQTAARANAWHRLREQEGRPPRWKGLP